MAIRRDSAPMEEALNADGAPDKDCAHLFWIGVTFDDFDGMTCVHRLCTARMTLSHILVGG